MPRGSRPNPRCPAAPPSTIPEGTGARYETRCHLAATGAPGWPRSTAAPLTALDTETTSLDSFAARIVGISLSVTAGEACYIPLAHGPGAPDQLDRERSWPA